LQPQGNTDRPSRELFGTVRGWLALDLPAGRAQPGAVRWVVATILAIGLSLAACRLLVIAGVALFPSTAGYGHFQFGDYAKLTIIGVLGASIAWPVVTFLTTRGSRLYLWLAIAVTVVGLAPDAWILHQGQPAAGVAVLVAMHFALAVITYPVLVFIAPQSRRAT
jgi:hypothetical protein